jgi:hypothetical protein
VETPAHLSRRGLAALGLDGTLIGEEEEAQHEDDGQESGLGKAQAWMIARS